jgi:hypothetical protein
MMTGAKIKVNKPFGENPWKGLRREKQTDNKKRRGAFRPLAFSVFNPS